MNRQMQIQRFRLAALLLDRGQDVIAINPPQLKINEEKVIGVGGCSP